jgi:hypothetical protein
VGHFVSRYGSHRLNPTIEPVIGPSGQQFECIRSSFLLKEGVIYKQTYRIRQNSSRENDPTISAVLHAVELALRKAASESLAINQGVPS